MNQFLLPTTRAQVSGHRFLLRRLEHGLVTGDTRLIHDPLGRRRRGIIIGIVGCVFAGLAAGAMAIFVPEPDPGDAAVVRAESGALYSRIDGRLHPVDNLMSARLIAGSDVDPVNAADSVLAEMERGVPLGIPGAPGVVAEKVPDDLVWSVCQSTTDITVTAGPPPPQPTSDAGVYATVDGIDHVVTTEGRIALPDPTTRFGRVLRRRLGITAETPVWEPPPEVLNAIRELPRYQRPSNSGVLLGNGRESWLLRADGILPLSPLQRGILLDLGASERGVPQDGPAARPDATPEDIRLPATALDWVDPGQATICAIGDDGHLGIVGDSETGSGIYAPGAGVALSGDSTATKYASIIVNGIGVDTGHGYYLISDSGLRHGVGDAGELRILGVEAPSAAPWSIIRLLPGGDSLTRERALEPRY
ncbi:type VII secretion protein EccB [Corynebacterium sp. CCM 9185]|uniref:Type VII secretion protein EccB n=1 Tax=Corynebacterium marambiense TaxID=2765364 RepID=A0ABS0VT20_9CORY|nr:type VII secretion protein EccB [Corynebacterium marambiense]MBI8999449.1 type VII secretion protein EccB [Corynebacterium marambiense]MCK7662287.1 type VII secretion protein EccB [Corynebacterium marambiense]